MSKYNLEIISTTNNQPYKKHFINGDNFIGVHENEPFKLKFTNNTHKKVQVRFSVDGTDILTGELANTEPVGKMFVVAAYDYVELAAWPEDDKGGAEFLFGKSGNSVAANTHGNMIAKGLLAVAVFEENYKEEERLYKGILRERRSLSLSDSLGDSLGDYDYAPACCREAESLAVGAGERIKQEITKVAGLREPKFAEIVQVRYENWNVLQTALRHPAFPGDKVEKHIDLKKTPRVEKSNFSRF